ncbi:hypothetical protein SDC9_64307 [bioreactor metagenome]|uniref:Uncharacterized protein n=1 Tax=bioreactor metagenome TaxID=1076179 RepID=A0A644XPJ9_9ZZZZ
MKYIFASAVIAALFLSSCGNSDKKDKEEMKAFEDSIKKDTSVNSSVNAANDFLNDTTATADSVANTKSNR